MTVVVVREEGGEVEGWVVRRVVRRVVVGASRLFCRDLVLGGGGFVWGKGEKRAGIRGKEENIEIGGVW